MEYINGQYYLNEQESDFMQIICARPDQETMNKRNNFFNQIDQEIEVKYEDGCMNVILKEE